MPAHREASLGTLLRHLIELLDGGVQRVYEASGLTYRPRYTPVVRALIKLGPCSVKTISDHTQISHSAASQTVAQMAKDGLVVIANGDDGRERIATMTSCLRQLLPALDGYWNATGAAARQLDEELSMPLSKIVLEAIIALEERSFEERIAHASSHELGTC